MVEFKRATKKQAKLRLALMGPAGAGKTYTALKVAEGLGGPIALIDTERGSASKYSGVTEFDVLELVSFAPERYIEAIRAAESGGYNVIVIDSLSHAWAGKDGILEFVDKRKAQSRGNDFAVWRDATPLQNQLVDAILASSCHIIATMRSKMEYVIEKDEKTGKSSPKKVGLQPVQRDQIEFEFDLVGDMDQDHTLVVTKSRIDTVADAVIKKPGADLGKQLLAWLSDGAPAAVSVPPVVDTAVETPVKTDGPNVDSDPNASASPPSMPAKKSAGVPSWWKFLEGALKEREVEWADLDLPMGVTSTKQKDGLLRPRASEIQAYIDRHGDGRDEEATLMQLVMVAKGMKE